jgi:hypothetical protein
MFKHCLHLQHLVEKRNYIMKTTLLNADTNGHTHLGWLNSFHTFSFGHYNQPVRVHFGAYRVLIKDTVAVVRRLCKHPHDNRKFISNLPLCRPEAQGYHWKLDRNKG